VEGPATAAPGTLREEEVPWTEVEEVEGVTGRKTDPDLECGEDLGHSATKMSIILRVNIVENFFWRMHASINSSCVIWPSWFLSISLNAELTRTS